MIVIDTSALMAIVLNEPQAGPCMTAIEQNRELTISAATLAADLTIETVPVTAAGARRVASAYARWGRGIHRAALNFGDCFAYALAKEYGCPLLFVGNDFARTDIAGAVL